MARRFRIPLAYWVSKDDLVRPSYELPYASLLRSGDAYQCPACQGELRLAKGSKVTPYFQHNPHGYTTKSQSVCTEETALHKIAKALLVKVVKRWVAGGEAPRIQRSCGYCHRKIETKPPANTATAIEEFVHNDRIHDVTLVDQANSPLLFIEVYVTHRTDRWIHGPWIELNAKAILESPLDWIPLDWGGLEEVNCCDKCLVEKASNYRQVDSLNPYLFDLTDNIFGENGLLAKVMGGYEDRPSQREFAKAVDQAIKEGKSLLAEAPCGTGKSVAYLSVALAHVLHSGGKVLVSTSNKALQNQIFDKDLPLVSQVLDRSIKSALMKGRSNYVCQDRLSDWITEEPDREDLRVVNWAHRTEDGDMERSGFEIDPEVAKRIGGNKSCSRICSKKDCFYQRAKKKTQEADVIVTNHAMLFAHFVVRRKLNRDVVLPNADIIICDEGHELAKRARQSKRVSIKEGGRNVGRQAHEKERLKQAEARFFYFVEAARREAVARSKILREGDSVEIHSPWINGHADAEYLQLVEEAAESWGRYLDDLLQAVEEQNDPNPWAEWSPGQRYVDEEEVEKAKTALERAQSLARNLSLVCSVGNDPGTESSMVYWIESENAPGCSAKRLSIQGRPAAVDRFISNNLFHRRGTTTIITSATLRSGGSFEYMTQELGFSGLTKAVSSPFDFSKQARLILPVDSEMPVNPTWRNRKQFLGHSADLFHKIAGLCGGGVLFLFASERSMKEVRKQIGYGFPYRILVQKELPNDRLVEEFKADTNSCLFGLDSFWGGLDVPGDALRCVVIEKLPFCTPSDPFFQHWKRVRGDDWARENMVLEAMIKMCQGAGRLIRSSQDHGVLVVLDRRIRFRYAKYMMKDIPWTYRWGVDSIVKFMSRTNYFAQTAPTHAPEGTP